MELRILGILLEVWVIFEDKDKHGSWVCTQVCRITGFLSQISGNFSNLDMQHNQRGVCTTTIARCAGKASALILSALTRAPAFPKASEC